MYYQIICILVSNIDLHGFKFVGNTFPCINEMVSWHTDIVRGGC